MLEYKGYIGKVEYDDEAKIFHGNVINTKSIITFQGTSVFEIEIEFKKSIDVYLDWCKNNGVNPEKCIDENLEDYALSQAMIEADNKNLVDTNEFLNDLKNKFNNPL